MTMKKTNNIRRCRLCACEESFNNFSNIFDDNPELDLEIKITKLLPIVVMPWDPMPHIICQECISKLNSFNDFYEASLKAERFLRTLHPSAPETELENVEPVVHVMDSSAASRDSLKLPPKKRASIEGLRMGDAEAVRASDVQANGAPFAKRPLDSFIINHITTRDSVFTCRSCYRTFTKQSTALAHSCVILEDCEMLESLRAAENGEKALPPLKIRLFSEKSGLFVCYLCQTAFERKADLVGHIKRHFVEDLEEVGKKCRQTGKRRGRPKKDEEEEDGDDDDWEEVYKRKATARKRRKSTEAPKKRGRKKAAEVAEPCQHGACEKCGKVPESPKTPARETMERMTQCSEVVSSSEVKDEEIEVLPFPDDDSVEMLPSNKPETVNEANENSSEDRTAIFETNWSPTPSPTSVEDPGEAQQGDDEIPPPPEAETPSEPNPDCDKSDEVTVLEVISNKIPTTFSSCVFCDKIFATKDALIAHQNKHLQNYCGSVRSEAGETETFLCSICAMTFTSRKMLFDHEHFHRVEEGTVDKIQIALNPQPPEQECQISKGRGILTITVTSRENKIPQIQLL